MRSLPDSVGTGSNINNSLSAENAENAIKRITYRYLKMEEKGGCELYINKPSKSDVDRKEILTFHSKRCFR